MSPPAGAAEMKNRSLFNTPSRHGNVTNPWLVQERASADGDKTAKFLAASRGGEQLTGILRSQRSLSRPVNFSWPP